MEDSSRTILMAVGILVVGMLVGYTIGRAGVKKARKQGSGRVAAAAREAEDAAKQTQAARKETQAARKETRAAQDALAVCTQRQAVRPPTPTQLVAPQRTEAVLRMTQAELALRSENAGIARSRLREAAQGLRHLAKALSGAAAAKITAIAGRLESLREATLRLDPRDRTAVERAAAELGELRRSIRYLPLGKTGP